MEHEKLPTSQKSNFTCWNGCKAVRIDLQSIKFGSTCANKFAYYMCVFEVVQSQANNFIPTLQNIIFS